MSDFIFLIGLIPVGWYIGGKLIKRVCNRFKHDGEYNTLTATIKEGDTDYDKTKRTRNNRTGMED